MSPGHVHYQDLPASARRELAGVDLPHDAGPRTATVSGSAPTRWRCHTCGKEFRHNGRNGDSWEEAEAHSDEQRHARIELVLA